MSDKMPTEVFVSNLMWRPSTYAEPRRAAFDERDEARVGLVRYLHGDRAILKDELLKMIDRHISEAEGSLKEMRRINESFGAFGFAEQIIALKELRDELCPPEKEEKS